MVGRERGRYRLGLAHFALDKPELDLARGDEWVFGPKAPKELNVSSPCGRREAGVRKSRIGVPSGIRTRVAALKGPRPGPARRWGLATTRKCGQTSNLRRRAL